MFKRLEKVIIILALLLVLTGFSVMAAEPTEIRIYNMNGSYPGPTLQTVPNRLNEGQNKSFCVKLWPNSGSIATEDAYQYVTLTGSEGIKISEQKVETLESDIDILDLAHSASIQEPYYMTFKVTAEKAGTWSITAKYENNGTILTTQLSIIVTGTDPVQIPENIVYYQGNTQITSLTLAEGETAKVLALISPVTKATNTKDNQQSIGWVNGNLSIFDNDFDIEQAPDLVISDDDDDPGSITDNIPGGYYTVLTIKGLSAGTGTLSGQYSSSNGKFTSDLPITVTAKPTLITNPNALIINVGNTETITAKATPAGTSLADLKWEISPEGYLTVISKDESAGTITVIATAASEENITISATLNGLTAFSEITIDPENDINQGKVEDVLEAAEEILRRIEAKEITVMPDDEEPPEDGTEYITASKYIALQAAVEAAQKALTDGKTPSQEDLEELFNGLIDTVAGVGEPNEADNPEDDNPGGNTPGGTPSTPGGNPSNPEDDNPGENTPSGTPSTPGGNSSNPGGTSSTTPLPSKVTVSVSSLNNAYGTVSGSGNYTILQKVTLKATPKAGYEFAGWKNSDGAIISKENPYIFTATGNVNLTAVFRKIQDTTPDQPEIDNPSKPEEPNTPGDTTEQTIPIYRLYNRVSGEHLYTPNKVEVSALTKEDWNNEGVAWYAPMTGTPVYRLYNSVLNNHLYTTDIYEVTHLVNNEGWIKDFEDAPIFYSGGDIPVYRLYNPELNGEHLLTTDYNEYTILPAFSWRQESIAFNAIK